MLEDTDALRNLVEILLTLSRGDAGSMNVQRSPVELGALAREVAQHIGLGLSIARWAVEAQGGQLTLETTAPKGATFRIELPRNEVD